MFHEEAAPNGYVAVTDFTFTVKANGTVTLGTIAQGDTVTQSNGKITVTDQYADQTVSFSKVDLGGTEIAGAKIEIKQGDTVVRNWTSVAGQTQTIQLQPGTYVFHEEAAPNGYLAVTDFEFTMNPNGIVTLGTIAQGDRITLADGVIQVTDAPKPVPNDFYFCFTKEWIGGSAGDIRFTLYNEDGTVHEHGFRKTQISDREWLYECWLSVPQDYYVIEEPIKGYKASYQNIGANAVVKDRCYRGGKIVNYLIPQTGDRAHPALWLGLILVGFSGLGAYVVRRKKAKK